MRESEFWNALDWVFPNGRGKSLASDLVLAALGNRSPVSALAEGENPQHVWDAVCQAMDLPETYRYIHRFKAEDREYIV